MDPSKWKTSLPVKKINKFSDVKLTMGPYLAKGAFGRVYKGSMLVESKDLSKREIGLQDEVDVAIKEIEISGDANAKVLKQEIENMYLVKSCSPYAVEVYDVITTGDKLYIVMEFLDGAEMIKLKNKTDNDKGLISFYKQLMLGLKCFHDLDMIHGDIKPQNVMISKDFKTAKWIDFGLMCSIATCQPRGTPNYLDPQILTKPPSEVDWKATDIWSFGCLVYTVSSKHTVPFQAELYHAHSARRKGQDVPYPVFNVEDLMLPMPNFETSNQIIRACMQLDLTTRHSEWNKLMHQIVTSKSKTKTEKTEKTSTKALSPLRRTMSQIQQN